MAMSMDLWKFLYKNVSMVQKYNSINTRMPFLFSMLEIHIKACPCGSTASGHLVALETMIPFSALNASPTINYNNNTFISSTIQIHIPKMVEVGNKFYLAVPINSTPLVKHHPIKMF